MKMNSSLINKSKNNYQSMSSSTQSVLNSKNITKFYGSTYEMNHLVSVSPWPLLTSFVTLALVTSLTLSMHGYKYSTFFLFFSLISVILCMSIWWRDVIRESTYEGNHNTKVQLGLKLGMILFIISEVMFFFAFFWAFFHSSISPAIEIAMNWPPLGIETLNPFAIPLLNTVILLSSGAAVTWSHHALLEGSFFDSIISLGFTVILAIIFTGCQYFEYIHSNFTIADSVYGSSFFMATGFHGFHVIVGTIFLSVALVRIFYNHFTSQHHLGFEAGAWYWHFVDVVWLFLFATIYWWGGSANG